MVLCALLLLGLPSESTAGASPADTVAYVVSLGGTIVGSIRSVTETTADAGFVRRDQIAIDLTRGGEPLRFAETIETEEDAGGNLLRCRIARTGMGPSPWVDTLERDAAGWLRRRDRGGGAQIDTLARAAILGPIAIDRLFARPGKPPAEFPALDPVGLRPMTVRAERIRSDTLGIQGGRLPCDVHRLVDSTAASPTLQWRSADGSLVREERQRLGWTVERADVAASGSAPRAGPPVLDALDWASISFEGDPLGAPPCTLLLAVADLAGGRGAAAPIPTRPGQSVDPGPGPGEWTIVLDPPPVPSPGPAERSSWAADPSLSRALAPSLLVESDDPGVRRFAEEAVAGAAGPLQEALRAERAVHRHVRTVDLRTVFASAAQTLRDRRGDCTEHAVLLAAVLRARGIPARLVAGLVPAGETMGFHLWTEAYLGEWVGLDATLARGGPAPCAVGLSAWDDPQEGLEDFQRAIEGLLGGSRFVRPASR